MLSKAVHDVLEPPEGFNEGFLKTAKLINDNKDILEPPEGLKEGFKKGADKAKKNNIVGKITKLMLAAVPLLIMF